MGVYYFSWLLGFYFKRWIIKVELWFEVKVDFVKLFFFGGQNCYIVS